MRRILYSVLFVLVLVLGLTFVLKNPGEVTLTYYFGWQWSAPLAVVLLLALLAGVCLGWLVSLGWVLRIRHELAQLRRRYRRAEEELNNLRALPIKEPV